MKSSNILSLFAEQPPPRTTPSPFLVSILVHGALFGFLIALKHTPHLSDRSVVQKRSLVRILNPPRLETQTRRSVKSGAAHSAPASLAHELSPGGGPATLPSVPEQKAQLPLRSHLLVQPDTPPDVLLPQETPVPLVVMWSPENPPIKTIVAPPPQETTAAPVLPSFAKPNHESTLANLNISMSSFPTETVPIPVGATAPLVVRGPEPVKQVPETASQQIEKPTPARVMSLTDMQAQGPVVIPLANQTAQGGPTEILTPQRPEKSPGNGNPVSKQNGMGPGEGSGDQRGTAAPGAGSMTQHAAKAGPDQGSSVDSGLGNEPSISHITLPKDGQFGVVVVGSPLGEQYPETVGIWSGRLVYTVYLHVGLGKNWILQYSLPRAGEAAATGSTARPEAPWPYEIGVPHLAYDDFNSEAVMVRGFVNAAGRFDRLALVFPAQFAQATFLLRTLQQWQFRPARQNGQIAAVEVLLIIPDQSE